MRRLLLPLFTLIFIQVWAQDQAELFQQDIDYFGQELSTKHYNLFNMLEKETFFADLDLLKAKAPNLTEAEFAMALQRIAAKAGDSHTNVIYGSKIKNGPIFPLLTTYWFEEGIYILKTTSSNRILLGKKLVAINNIPIEKVVERLSTLFAPDNDALVKNNIPKMLSSASILSFLNITTLDQARFTIESEDGTTQTLTFNSIPVENFHKYEQISLAQDSTHFSKKDRKTWFWSRYFPEEEIFYVQYNSCNSREVQKKYYRKDDPDLPSFKAFEKEVFQQLGDKPIKKFVFDMRYNGGGSSLQGTKFIKKLAKYKDINFQEKIYVITGRNTFSSAILNTLDFQSYTDAILIGEATSGKPNHFGEIKSFVLPNSKLKVYYSTKYFKKVEEDMQTIWPDIILEERFTDYQKGLDPVWEYIINAD